MKSKKTLYSDLVCPFQGCPSHSESEPEGPALGRRVRPYGYFRRKVTPRKVKRFLCRRCFRTFSMATFEPEYRQQRRDLNEPLKLHLSSQMSLRRAALLLGAHPDTVARRFRFLAEQARKQNEAALHEMTLLPPEERIQKVQFDEMESSIHSKLKPVSIPLIVCAKTRRILAFSVAEMPAKGHLAKPSLKKYGVRKDERPQAAIALLKKVRPVLHPKPEVRSDQKKTYPEWLKKGLGQDTLFTHESVKGRRGCVVGQGELKRVGFDPIFSLNHTAAMIRANVNRMARRTWCTSKKQESLIAHLHLYVHLHNTVLIQKTSRKKSEALQNLTY